ncbi:unnamed protein product, partial [Prorocentrum cordatum]
MKKTAEFDDIRVAKLRARCSLAPPLIQVKAVGLSDVKIPPRAAGAGGAPKGPPTAAGDSEGARADEGPEDAVTVVEAIDADTSDVGVLFSDVASDMDDALDEDGPEVDLAGEGCPPELAPEPDDVPGVVDRAPRGTHAAWKNAFFTLTGNMGWPNAKMILLGKWATGHLGGKGKSKTLTIAQFDGPEHPPNHAAPEMTHLALRAWM